MQITTTASIPTNNIMVFPRIYYNLGKPIILLVDLKSGKSITISLLESSHGGNLKVDTYLEREIFRSESTIMRFMKIKTF